MIKAIFFDWFGTLARFDPPREELHSKALREFGVEIRAGELTAPVLTADKYFFEENVRSPVGRRNPGEQAEVYMRYQSIVLTEAGVKADKELIIKLVKKMQQLFKETSFVLFDDVLPTLKTLKERKFVLGLLTNANQDMIAIHRKLGLGPYLDFVITSQEVGADKPEPPIFMSALERASVKASEAIHVGDQYIIDVAGARGAGIKPILIDRYNLYPEVSDCSRISNLTELAQYL